MSTVKMSLVKCPMGKYPMGKCPMGNCQLGNCQGTGQCISNGTTKDQDSHLDVTGSTQREIRQRRKKTVHI